MALPLFPPVAFKVCCCCYYVWWFSMLIVPVIIPALNRPWHNPDSTAPTVTCPPPLKRGIVGVILILGFACARYNASLPSDRKAPSLPLPFPFERRPELVPVPVPVPLPATVTERRRGSRSGTGTSPVSPVPPPADPLASIRSGFREQAASSAASQYAGGRVRGCDRLGGHGWRSSAVTPRCLGSLITDGFHDLRNIARLTPEYGPVATSHGSGTVPACGLHA